MIKSITNFSLYFSSLNLKCLELTKMELTRFAMKLFKCWKVHVGNETNCIVFIKKIFNASCVRCCCYVMIIWIQKIWLIQWIKNNHMIIYSVTKLSVQNERDSEKQYNYWRTSTGFYCNTPLEVWNWLQFSRDMHLEWNANRNLAHI